MKKMKAELAPLMAAVLMMCSVVLTERQSKSASANQVAGAMYDLVVKENTIPMKDLLGSVSEDDVRPSLPAEDYTEMTDMLKDQFGRFSIDFMDEEAREMPDTMIDLLNELSHMAEIQSETKDETTIPFEVTGYSNDGLAQIMNDLIIEMQTNMDEEVTAVVISGDEEAAQKLMQDVIKQSVAKAGEMEPSAGTTDMIAKCEKMKMEVSDKEKVSWMPVDIDKFASSLEGVISK